VDKTLYSYYEEFMEKTPDSLELQDARYKELLYLAINMSLTYISEHWFKYKLKMLLAKHWQCYPINFTVPSGQYLKPKQVEKIRFLWDGKGIYPVAFTRVIDDQSKPFYETVFLQQKGVNEFAGLGMVSIDLRDIRVDGTIHLVWLNKQKTLKELGSFTLKIVYRQTKATIGPDGQEIETPWETLTTIDWQKLTEEDSNVLPISFQLTDKQRETLTMENPPFKGAFQLYLS
jgi:hypothetical protein